MGICGENSKGESLDNLISLCAENDLKITVDFAGYNVRPNFFVPYFFSKYVLAKRKGFIKDSVKSFAENVTFLFDSPNSKAYQNAFLVLNNISDYKFRKNMELIK